MPTTETPVSSWFLLGASSDRAILLPSKVGPKSLNAFSKNSSEHPASLNPNDAPISQEGRARSGSRALFRPGICMPHDRFSHSWSLSAKCMDKDVVLEKTTRINGLNGWIAAFFGLFAVFIAGQIVDTTGRRPVLIAFLSSNIIVKALLFISCFSPYSIFVATLLAK